MPEFRPKTSVHIVELEHVSGFERPEDTHDDDGSDKSK